MPDIALPTPANKLPLRRTVDGWHVLEIRGARDIPGYNPTEVGRGMSVQTYRREVLGDWTASAGKLVFPEYGDMHDSLAALPFDPSRPLLCGWDLPAATGGTPAFVASQLTQAGQWLIYGSVQPREDETVGVWDFGERVAYWLRSEFADAAGCDLADLRLVHYADPAGAQRALGGRGSAAVELKSAFDILRDGEKIETGPGQYVERVGWGWDIEPGEVSLTARLEAIRTRLMVNVLGGPAILLDPLAVTLREAFRGGYHYHQRGDGRYELDPAKNKYSHPMDALGYIASMIFLHPTREDPYARYQRAQGSVGAAVRGGRVRGR